MVLAAELVRRGHLVVRQQLVSFDYEGLHFENAFRIDLLVDDSVIVELKSAEKMSPVFYKQLKTYLVLAERSVGLVLNFGMATMVDGIKRVVHRYDDSGTHENVFLRGDADLRENVSRGAAEPQRLGGVVGGLANETTAQSIERGGSTPYEI